MGRRDGNNKLSSQIEQIIKSMKEGGTARGSKVEELEISHRELLLNNIFALLSRSSYNDQVVEEEGGNIANLNLQFMKHQ